MEIETGAPVPRRDPGLSGRRSRAPSPGDGERPILALRLPRSETEAVLERRLAEAAALDDACNGLARRQPHLSARFGLSDGQQCGLWSLASAIPVMACLTPHGVVAAAIWVAAIVFACGIALRLAAAISAWTTRPRAEPEAIDFQPPTITYLVPLYKEDNIAPALIKALMALDYPAHLLDIKLLVEIDDVRTINVLRGLNLPQRFEILPCPPSTPRTKPKALNYGLQFARGDIIAVLDAEDIPDPAQPLAAARAFAEGGAKLAVVQAPLLAHNGDAGWIARQFEIEYAIHFRVWLPFVARLGWPMLLGGTSNYFRRTHLVDAGGWDAWNVTEDADLGLRLARHGRSAKMIAPPTLEEAPVRFTHWLSQRTRWKKGHLQTWLVLMRNPGGAIADMGLRQFIGAQLALGGGLLASMVHGPSIIVLGIAGLTASLWPPAMFLALLGTGYGAVLFCAIAAGGVRKRIGALASLPLYLPLISFAMLCALWDMKAQPYKWAKTPHGVKPG